MNDFMLDECTSNTENGKCIRFSYVNKVTDIGFLEGDFLGVLKGHIQIVINLLERLMI